MCKTYYGIARPCIKGRVLLRSDERFVCLCYRKASISFLWQEMMSSSVTDTKHTSVLTELMRIEMV